MKTEIKGTKTNEVDWSKNPQLVISTDKEVLIMVLENQSDVDSSIHFSGIVLESLVHKKSTVNHSWIKEMFQPFDGTIELSND